MVKQTLIGLCGLIVFGCTAVDAKPRTRSASLVGVVEPLATKAREIVSVCGSKVVSTVRSWGATPNHRQGKAVDLQGNPSCIYRLLAGWPGGVSTDYHTAPGGKHVHVSYSRRHEWGLRFAHRKARGSRTLHARSVDRQRQDEAN